MSTSTILPSDQAQPNNDTTSFSQSNVKQVLRYWRNSIADAQRMKINPNKMQNREKISLEEYKSGKICSKKIKRFFDHAESELNKKLKKQRKYSKKARQDEEICIEKISVLITPYTFIKEYEHGIEVAEGNIPKKIFPLYLIAEITKDGLLPVPEDIKHPWIERRCLTPNETSGNSASIPILGDISEVDEYYERNTDSLGSETNSWKNFVDYAEQLFQSLIKCSPENYVHELYKLISEGLLLPVANTQEMSMSMSLTMTYDELLHAEENKIPKIIRNLCDMKHVVTRPELSNEALLLTSKKHLGEMPQSYSLAASQRVSINYLSMLEDDEIFAINGPPGTGKTTLILSIIASEWVKSAIDQNPPPILVASSTNNRAVTNILDRLVLASHSDKLKFARWIPNIRSYGFYLAPSTKQDSAITNNYPYRLKKGNYSSLDFLYEESFQHKAQQHYISTFNEFFNSNEDDIEACQKHIHNLLVKKQKILNDCISVAKNLHALHQQHGDIKMVQDQLVEARSKVELLAIKQTKLHSIDEAWLDYKSKHLFWPSLFKWLPPVRTFIQDQVKQFSMKNKDIFDGSINCISTLEHELEKKIICMNTEYQAASECVNKIEKIFTQYQKHHKNASKLEDDLKFKIDTHKLFNYESQDNVLALLDKIIRQDLFALAIHYWEASWLLENKKTQFKILKYDFDSRKKFWQIQAMLTPCFITTLHTGPIYFQHKVSSNTFKVSTGMIDLLIIDEAGQVMPATAAPMISIAKKAILVGDDLQLEPIFNIPQSIDIANAKKFGLCTSNTDYVKLITTGILCSGNPSSLEAYGNLMKLGRRRTQYHLTANKQAGMMLKEHRRCAKKIISYCNELCYDNALQVLTQEKPTSFPQMGYAHVKGKAKKHGSSRTNVIEAECIVEWLAKNIKTIKKETGADTASDCVAIITPYAQQGKILKTQLKKSDIELESVGTVHSLQGAEKPFVIFSPVVTAEESSRTHFFDKSPNMLNVTVSRAQQAFLVFGDMDIFDISHRKKPSSLLARYLFSEDTNEITDIIHPVYKKLIEQEALYIKAVSTLAEHRHCLTNAFAEAQTELNIVSPFITTKAIEADNIVKHVRDNSDRIKINIFTDPSLNELKMDAFTDAIDLLEQAGAQVFKAERVHSKIITIDKKTIIAGSFNWLSASRSTKYARIENSFVYNGSQVESFIQKTINPIRKRVISKIKE